MKKYLVTGASRGIGMATAKSLVNDGHFVYGTYNTGKDVAESLTDELSNLEMIQVELAEYKSIDSLVESLSTVQLDGIVNSAGVFEEIDFDKFDIEALEKNFKVNTFAPIYLVNKLSSNLVGGASIVNVSSTDGMVGSYVGMGYAASKAAISNLTLSLANILAERNIRVNAVAPGWIGDGMQAPDELLKLAADYNPLKKLGTYEDVANIVCYLLSDKAGYVNGTVIVADGGDMAKNYILEQESKLL